jgi:hypothetical protein
MIKISNVLIIKLKWNSRSYTTNTALLSVRNDYSDKKFCQKTRILKFSLYNTMNTRSQLKQM